MREAAFLQKHADKWEQFELLLTDRENMHPDILADLFVQLTDDVSYARTYYPDSKTTKYLNTLAAKVHQEIYRNKREKGNRFVKFWKYEVPEAMFGARRELLYSLVIFAVAVLIGVISTARDDTFARLILGDRYVNMTLENIRSGDPLGVYGKENQLDMFFSITYNNVQVSFYAFVLGLLYSLGTAYLLFRNGVMLGVFHTFLHQEGYLAKSLTVVYIHGAFEISAIIIAGAAGLVLGNSMLFPGTYSRSESFKRGARRGVKIIVGLVPFFIAAGFLESFVTRYTEMPLALSLFIILGSLAAVIYYFVLYPSKIFKNETIHADTKKIHRIPAKTHI
ncbi:MAG TPA: stage II sporulation protein M [Patescibacteria group bacterium]|nr:stage II sporulation protein M [Patescibacteria group bacterium]